MDKVKCGSGCCPNHQDDVPNDATVFVSAGRFTWVARCDKCSYLAREGGVPVLPIVYPPEIKPEPPKPPTMANVSTVISADTVVIPCFDAGSLLEERLAMVQAEAACDQDTFTAKGLIMALAGLTAEVLAIARKGGKP